MKKGYFYAINVDNETEIKVVDAFVRKAESKYFSEERYKKNEKPVLELEKPWLTTLGLLAAFLLLIFLYDDKNYIIVILSLLSLIGYGYTYFQLLRSKNYIKSIRETTEEVHNYHADEEKMNKTVKR